MKIVENGIPNLSESSFLTKIDSSGAYLNVPGRNPPSTEDNWNYSNIRIGADDDFVMLAKLKIEGSGSEAQFILNDNDNFGFDGGSNNIFADPPSIFRTSIIVGDYNTHNNNLFYFKVERKVGTIKIFINEIEVASNTNYDVAITKFRWRPWRGTLKIYEWTISGSSFLSSTD